jgi:hypothetical protein
MGQKTKGGVRTETDTSLLRFKFPHPKRRKGRKKNESHTPDNRAHRAD